ncbi:probable E3 ubiquitin ligase complex SCF subunit sconB [Vanessa atalanta]|uniref:probable E3 ubiquitin ligase complex SCF subunit sconB n=1 Tax=Vanessa atalanta TaxID=42275 RepID=UPI001FCD1B40|nr:probable E3 ubiquitin ligase complex SCF subunit sconB [Vanessa atalanta]
MFDTGIFVFGSKIFEVPRRDAISCLPLEVSWRIFSYLDKVSLRNACHASKTWKRIIIVNKKLRKRINQFELVFKLGSEKMANFHRRNKRLLKKLTAKNYLPVGKTVVESTTKTVSKSKRGGEDLVLCTKRFKLF